MTCAALVFDLSKFEYWAWKMLHRFFAIRDIRFWFIPTRIAGFGTFFLFLIVNALCECFSPVYIYMVYKYTKRSQIIDNPVPLSTTCAVHVCMMKTSRDISQSFLYSAHSVYCRDLVGRTHTHTHINICVVKNAGSTRPACVRIPRASAQRSLTKYMSYIETRTSNVRKRRLFLKSKNYLYSFYIYRSGYADAHNAMRCNECILRHTHTIMDIFYVK